jgi:hypothetical protein
MADVITKVDDNTIRVEKTQSHTFNVKMLKIKRKQLVERRKALNDEIDKVDALLAEADALGVGK